jgi:hypothetical protein
MRYGGLAVAASSSKLCLRAGSGKKKRRKRRGWLGQGKWATRTGNETGPGKKTNGMCGKNQQVGLMRGIQARFKRFCFSFSFFRCEIFEYCLNWIQKGLKVYKFWGFTALHRCRQPRLVFFKLFSFCN